MIQSLYVEIQIDTEKRATNRVERGEILGVARPDALDRQELWMKRAKSYLSKTVLPNPGEGPVKEDT